MNTVAQLRDELNAEVLRIVKSVGVQMSQKIAAESPIDTGRLMSSWSLSDAPPVDGQDVMPVLADNSRNRAAKDYQVVSADQALAIVESKEQNLSGQSATVYVFNGTDYVEGLETGNPYPPKHVSPQFVKTNTNEAAVKNYIDIAIQEKPF